MKQFKVLFSSHNEDGVDYNAGDIVKTHRDLNITFPNKFEKLADIPKSPKAVVADEEDEDDVEPGDDEETDEDGEEEADAGEEPAPKKKKTSSKKK